MPRGNLKIPIPAPYLGMRTDLLPWKQPMETVVDGQNLVFRDQRVYVRSGVKPVSSSTFGERVMGGLFWKRADLTEVTIAAGTVSRKCLRTDGVWQDITGTPWTGDEDDQARFTVFPAGDSIYVIGVNGVNPPIVWDGIGPGPSVSASPSMTVSETPSTSPSGSATPSLTPSETPSLSATPSVTPSGTPSRTVSGTPSITGSLTPSRTPSVTPSRTVSATPSESVSNTPSATPSFTPSQTPSETPSRTLSQTPSFTPSFTPSNTPSNTVSNTPSFTPSASATPSFTPSETPSATEPNLPSFTPSRTPSVTPSVSSTPSRTLSRTVSRTPSATLPFGHDLDLGGGAPIAKDITTVSNRVIYGNVYVGGVSYPCSFMFSAFNDHTSTPASNIVTVTEGYGPIIAVRNLGLQSFAIYSERAQLVATLTGGVTIFRVDFRSGQTGPASPSAVVNAGGESHYYMGRDGNFYRFDGSRCVAIGDAVKTKIQAIMNSSYMQRAHGFFDRQNREITWFFPTKGTTEIYGGITYDIDANVWSTPHQFAFSLSAGFEWDEVFDVTWADLTGTWLTLGDTYPTWTSMGSSSRTTQMLGDADGTMYIYGGAATDNGNPIEAFGVYPAKPLAGDGQIVRVDCFEAYYKQTHQPMDLEIHLGHSGYPGGTIVYEDAQTFDMSSSVLAEAEYVDVNARNVGIKFRVTEKNQGFEWHGGVLYAYQRGVAA